MASGLNDLELSHTFNGDPTATGYINAAQLDAVLAEIVAWLNTTLKAGLVDGSFRSDNTLADGLIRQRMLHAELGELFPLLKAHMDNGLTVLAECRMATTGNHALSGLTAVDGVTPIAGDRVLVRAQTDNTENGVYVAAAGAWSRATDADAFDEIGYACVYVDQGTQLARTAWICAAGTSGTIGATAITWRRLYQGSHDTTSYANYVTERFVAGVGFVAGSTTTLPLSESPGSVNNTLVTFDGVVQHKSTYTVTTTNVVFTSAIPTGVLEVEVVRASVMEIAVPADGSVLEEKIGAGAVTASKIADQIDSEVVKSAIDNTAQGFRMDVRDALTSFPVPCIRPTTATKVMALDVCPNGAPADYSNNGVAWIDVCDTDYQTGDPAGCATRVGATSTYLEIGLRAFNGATKKPLYITNQAVKVMEFEVDGHINSGFSSNGRVDFKHRNANAGASAYADVIIQADNAAKAGHLRAYSDAFSADSSNYAGRVELLADGTDLMLGGNVIYFTGGYPYSTKRQGAIDANGNWTIGRTPSFAAYHSIGRGTAEGDQILLIETNCFFYRVGNTGYNAAAAALKIGRNTSTSRSINAAGTVNASGADYAEYLRKADGCGTIAKGQVCGIDAAGQLTDRFDQAHSFVVKSTDPSYVGGDTWGEGLEGEALEAERQRWDRIAFSGRVPCLVTGAAVGAYIVPRRAADGAITAEAVASPSFDDYRAAIGKVWSVDEAGIPLIAVKVG